jgi:hypothetical protein
MLNGALLLNDLPKLNGLVVGSQEHVGILQSTTSSLRADDRLAG